MSDLTFHWFLPTNGGDGRHVVGGGHGVQAGSSGRPGDVGYLTQVARAAEDNGFEAALTPAGAWCQDAWVTTAMLTQTTERLKYLVAFRPGLVSPYLAAQMAATYVNLSGGRLLLNVVTGGENHEQQMYGDFLDKEERYQRCDEFLTIVRRLWAGEEVDWVGDHLALRGARLNPLPIEPPEIYFGGSSLAAVEVAARHADVYLTWGESPDAVAKKIAHVRARAAVHGRTVRFGIRMHTITRETEAEAWAEADRLLAQMTPEAVAAVQSGLARSESEGQRRMRELHAGRTDRLEIHPNVWAGIGLVRGGAGTALVGSHEQVADRIEEYAGLGIDEFVLSAYPHLEGAYWFGEGVLPILEERGRWKSPVPRVVRPSAVPFALAGRPLESAVPGSAVSSKGGAA
ncbi:LLM class flavin-dependent oxidoreductase [Nocardioides daejeonensis]|uniref:LLM class flavin-dependent oxidoreductase n=1 Tax=Nocardioides daejeonensis TaxID=1046556 RepID=UPI000D746531|nr:LLM class flavin-dependent oxidoreductase [Nocardioides daejeonensis]